MAQVRRIRNGGRAPIPGVSSVVVVVDFLNLNLGFEQFAESVVKLLGLVNTKAYFFSFDVEN